MGTDQQQINVGSLGVQTARALNEAPLVKCPKCGGILWDETSMVKAIPGLYTGKSHDQIVPIPVLVCRKCGEILPQMSAMDEFKKLLGQEETKEEKKQTILTT